MIVISQAWEFVPKGSSHFNYHTNSSTGNACNKLNDLATASATAAAAVSGGGGGGGGLNAGVEAGSVDDAASGNLRSMQKGFSSKPFGRHYDRIKIAEDSNNISLNELSFAGYYISKSPVAMSNHVQYDSNVSLDSTI